MGNYANNPQSSSISNELYKNSLPLRPLTDSVELDAYGKNKNAEIKIPDIYPTSTEDLRRIACTFLYVKRGTVNTLDSETLIFRKRDGIEIDVLAGGGGGTNDHTALINRRGRYDTPSSDCYHLSENHYEYLVNYNSSGIINPNNTNTLCYNLTNPLNIANGNTGDGELHFHSILRGSINGDKNNYIYYVSFDEVTGGFLYSHNSTSILLDDVSNSSFEINRDILKISDNLINSASISPSLGSNNIILGDGHTLDSNDNVFMIGQNGVDYYGNSIISSVDNSVGTNNIHSQSFTIFLEGENTGTTSSCLLSIVDKTTSIFTGTAGILKTWMFRGKVGTIISGQEFYWDFTGKINANGTILEIKEISIQDVYKDSADVNLIFELMALNTILNIKIEDDTGNLAANTFTGHLDILETRVG